MLITIQSLKERSQDRNLQTPDLGEIGAAATVDIINETHSFNVNPRIFFLNIYTQAFGCWQHRLRSESNLRLNLKICSLFDSSSSFDAATLFRNRFFNFQFCSKHSKQTAKHQNMPRQTAKSFLTNKIGLPIVHSVRSYSITPIQLSIQNANASCLSCHLEI